MKKFKFGSRVLALILTFIMVLSLVPASVFAAINDIATGTAAGDTGIDNDTLGDEGTINWPVKVYDYLADGMLFEYSSYNGTTVSSDPALSYGGGQYAYGKPMPTAALGTDYTSNAAYSESAYDYQYNDAGRGVRYTRTAVAAVNNTSPRYLRLKINTSSSSSGNRNFYVSDFINDNEANKYYNDVRYMVMVYRSSGMPTSTTTDYFGTSMAPMSFLIYHNNSSWLRYNVTSWTNSTTWTYRVIDLYSLGWTSGYTPNLSITPNFNNTGDYLDLSHVAYFTTSAAATEYGQQCVEFNNDPGEYLNANSWNGGNNLGFGMLLPSSGGGWSTGGGANSKTNGYNAYSVGYRQYLTNSDTYNQNRKDINGNLIGDSNKIYYVSASYKDNATYQNNLANDSDTTNDTDYLNGYNTNDLDLDGYSLLTYVTQGLATVGLLEGTLGTDGTPQYRQEAVEYIAQMLYNSLVIPQKDSSGNYNYNYVTGNKSTQYGTDSSGNALDLAQALRNCLGITFTSGQNKGYFPASTSTRTYGYGSYEGTLTRANNEIGLKGKFLDVKNNIHTCMDAAYYLLNNIFVDNSYNQLQNDYRYLTLSSATLDNGDEAFVFDGGFSTGADPADLESGTLTQAQYLAQTQSAVEYNSLKDGKDGTITMGPVQAKDKYYYSGSSTTTRFPFLPVTDAEGDYAGETRHYYFAEDGYRSYTDEFGTYVNRNYNYVVASNGEFVYTEEDGLFFEFEGDDDVYLFINGQLVLDIGGAHSITNVRFDVNDYVYWAREVLKNPSDYTAEEIARAEALDLSNGEIASFDFYYMERHGYGANMRIVTNMHITDPKLRVEKTAYQGKQVEYGGIVDADDPIEYNFKLSNIGNTKLYNLTFDDSDIGVSLTPDNGLFVVGDDTETELDDINGYIVTDARGGRLEAQDLTAVITGYQQVDSGGDYVQNGHEYTKVEAGTGTHIYYDALTITFADNEALKSFLKTLQSDKTDNETVDEELTQSGSGLWVDSSVTFKGIYYTMTEEQEDAGVFNNTVNVTGTTKSDPEDPASETLRSEARHRVYVTAIPSYYQWAGHDLFISKQLILDDASAEAGNTGSMLHDYIAFFNAVNGDANAISVSFCDRMGNTLQENDYEFVKRYQNADNVWGFKTNYDTPGIYEFYLLMYLNGKSGNISTMNLGEYAVVRVLVIVTDTEDAEYVLDYGLSTENLDVNGELFKNDELYGSMSGTEAKLMGVSASEPGYLNVLDGTSEYNRIDFDAMSLEGSNKIDVEDGYYTFNMAIPEEGKTIQYDEYSGMYSLTDAGTTLIHADVPLAWEEMYLYYWYDDGRDNVWPGTPMTMTSHGNFELAIPGNVPHIILSNGTNQSVDIHLNPGQEAWVDISGDLNTENKLVASIEYKTADGILHAAVPEDWGDVYIYCWDAFGNGLEEWPGVRVETQDADGFYTYTLPGDITNVIVNNGDKGKQTSDLVVYAGEETWITVNNEPSGTNTDIGIDYYGATSSRSTETITLHATVPSDWEAASVYYWNSNGSPTGIDWPGISMTKGEDGTYSVSGIPADVTNVIINDGKRTGAKQTGDIIITPGLETWINVEPLESNITVQATVPSDWGQAYFYFFNEAGDVGTAWPGEAAVDIFGNGTYSMKAPAYATHVIINNNGGRQTQNLALTPDQQNSFTISSDNLAASAGETTMIISAPADWTTVNLHYWGANGSTGWPGVTLDTKDANGNYVYTIPAGNYKFIVNNGTTQTTDVEIPYLGGENIVTVYSDGGYTVSTSKTIETKSSASISYGENAEEEGFNFTPTDFMDSEYSIYLALTVHETDINASGKPTPLGEDINIGKEVQMYKKVSVLPASVVYYEDDFAGITYNYDSGNTITHYGNGSGSLSQSNDQSQEYGQDSTYQGSENDEMTGGSLTDVYINNQNTFATFDFTGTGFEIVGHTHAEGNGTLMVTIKQGDTIVKQVPVITEFDNGANGGTDSIVSVPLVRVNGLEFGSYTVELSGVPIFDFTHWNGQGMPPVTTSYLCIDGVRIYQPLTDTDVIERTNLALGKTYEAQIAEAASLNGDYYDANLTDGVYATEIDFTNRSEWFGFHKTLNAAAGVGYITVDLGEEYDLDTFRMHLSANDSGASVGQPQYVEVAVSTDGVNYNFAGNLSINASATAAYWATLELDTAQTGRYVRFYVYNNADGLYWNFLNEIEVYGGKSTTTVGSNDAYLDTEDGATFTEIRNLIIDRNAFVIKYDDADGLSVSGGTNTWIENRNGYLPGNRTASWTNNTVNSVNDYLLAGPNNEVYMIESTDAEKSALAFYVQETDSDVHNMQIAVRAVDYGSYIGSQVTGLLNAEIQYGAEVDGELVWKTLTTTVTSTEQYFTIPYTECPYDEENDRYQVVLRVADTDPTGMASFTSLKYNGLELLELNATEVPDVIYDDELVNNLIDGNGNTLDTSKFVGFIDLVDQMTSDTEVGGGTEDKGETEVPSTPEVVNGVDTSALGVLYDTFTADTTTDFGLNENSRFYIVSSESVKPSEEIQQTVKLAQSQFAADGYEMDIVWGSADFAQAGDILVYVNAGYNYGDEEYRLVVSDRAKIYSKDVDALLYGLNTLQKHFRKAGTNAIEGFTIQDKPDTAERTVHLDIARKYLTKDWICNYIAEMSWMGYNTLELHLAEDGGFRSNIWDGTAEGFESPTGNDFSWAIGSEEQYWNAYVSDPDKGKYLTGAELVEICETAVEYHIDIVPSFDTPAHVGWMTKHYYELVQGGNTAVKKFNYGGTSYTLPNYINDRGTTSDGYFAQLNLGNANVQKFAFAMYTDLAAFFKQYAGSTDFNIGGDEVALTSSFSWDYADFINYINDLNSVLKSQGYTVRMYNDFLDRTTYINQVTSAGGTVPALAADIELVYWDAPSTNTTTGIQTASYWINKGRVVHSGVQNWSYYVLRIADASSVSTAYKGMDARDPNNLWWSFTHNTEDRIYNEWNPTRFSEFDASYTDYYSGDLLASGYFMVWCDYAGVNTEVEMWNGVWDDTGTSSDGKYFYSLIERMWSSAIKQWNWDINSTLTFANYETLRDTLGYFPGYVATASTETYAKPAVLPASTELDDTAYRPSYTVTFKNYDGTVLSTQTVRHGSAATAPATPTREPDANYSYIFSGWDTDFSNITGNTVVTAQYTESATVVGTVGNLEIKVSGGTNFTLSVNDGIARPMGTKYSDSVARGSKVTVTAQTTNGNVFFGWVNAIDGTILSTDLSYTFYTTGSEVLLAVFETDLEGKYLVTFKNDKTNQILDMQYYAPGDTVVFPDDPTFPGYEFAEWSHTAEQIQKLLEAGEDVTVTPEWNMKNVYFTIAVSGGSITYTTEMNSSAQYIGYKGTVVTAAKAPADKIFAYWTDASGNIVSYDEEYKFYPYEDMELTAVYLPKTYLEAELVDIKTTPDPTVPETEPSEPDVDPSEPEVDPSEPEVDPSEPEVDPSEPEVDPSEPEVDPSEPEVDPSEPEVDPSEPEVDPSEPETDPSESESEPETSDTLTVYFTNNWLWTEVSIYYWGVDGAPGWPGEAMVYYDTDANGNDIYVAEIPTGITGMIINGIKNDGSGNSDQTPDIVEFVDGRGYSMTWDNGNQVIIDDSRVESTEDTGASEETTQATEPESEPETSDTFTVYFTNNWQWSDICIYYWNDNNSTNNGWPGTAMTLSDDCGTDDVADDVYVAEIPVDITGMIINGIKNDGSGNRDQTPNIVEFVDGRGYSMAWDNGNQVVIDDTRVKSALAAVSANIPVVAVEETTEAVETNTVYLQVSSDWAQDGAWFAIYAWDDSGNGAWYALTNVIGNVYSAETPVEYSHIYFARMNPASTEMSEANTWNKSVNLTVSPTDTSNMYVLNPGWEGNGTIGNMNTIYFINDRKWETVSVSFTDATGTYEGEMKFVETDENGNGIYSIMVPAGSQTITFKNGSAKGYTYTVSEALPDRAMFQIVEKETEIDYQILANVDMDAKTLGDSNMVFFSWSVPEGSDYTFVNAGVLLVDKDNYSESAFELGTLDSDVIKFVPAKKYQTATGMHSVTIPDVSTGDTWIACTFVQYRDEEGVLRVQYSDLCEVTK